MTQDIILRGSRISQDADSYLSLTSMWRVAGENDAKRPAKWQRLPTTRELVAALTQNVRFSDIIEKTTAKTAIYSKTGKGGGTFAHRILALAYAEYLHPEIGIEVREIALRFWAGDLTLLDRFNHDRRCQAQDDEQRVFLREKIRGHNQVLNQRVKDAGATQHYEFAEFHNAGYKGLYNGLDENAIHKRKSLRRDQRILDHMRPSEAAANWFRTTQAEERLRNRPVETIKEAARIHHDIGGHVRQAIRNIGGIMPEDVPVADGLSDARKRLRDFKKGQEKLK